MAWGKKSKQVSKSNATPSYNDELLKLLEEHKNFEPEFGTCARTRAIEKLEGYLEYRRAERVSKTEWEVKTIKVYDYTGLTEDELKERDLDSISAEEQEEYKKGIVFECKTHTLKKDGKDVTRFNFVVAMSILADLEAKTLGADPIYANTNNSDKLEKYQKMVDLDPNSEVAQADYFGVSHYTTVAEWNNFAWDMEAISKTLRFGRMVKDGRYSEADLRRAYKNRDEALTNPPEDADLPGTLRQAFKGASGKNLDVWLKAVNIVNHMNDVMDKVRRVHGTMNFLKEQNRAVKSDWDDLEEQFTEAFAMLEDAEGAGAMVKTIRNELAQAQIAVEVIHGQKVLSEISDKTTNETRTKALLERIELIKEDIADICERHALGNRVAEAAVNEISSGLHGHVMDITPVVDSLDTLYKDYQEAHDQWQKKFKKGSGAASEHVQVMADKKPKATPPKP